MIPIYIYDIHCFLNLVLLRLICKKTHGDCIDRTGSSTDSSMTQEAFTFIDGGAAGNQMINKKELTERTPGKCWGF